MTLIAFIRHAPTAWNQDGRIQGHSDVSLSAEGRAIATDWTTPARFQDFEWVASPLARARETASLLGAKGCPTDKRLMEANWGEWEGRVLGELREELGEELERNEARGLDLQPPGGESPRAVRTRLAAWVAERAELGRPTVAVTHNGVIRAAYSLATGWDMTDRPDIEFIWGAAHLFMASNGGQLSTEELNISLTGTESR